MSNGEIFEPDSNPPWDSSVQFELNTPPESVVPPEDTDGVDWPPEVDAQGREMPTTGMWKNEPLPPLFNKDGSLTKTGYFACLCEYPWEFPFLPGHPPPPAEWAREAWESADIQDSIVYECKREISKTGIFNDLTGQGWHSISEVLTTNQVIRFFQEFRNVRGEYEYRFEFELGFPEHAPFLPAPIERPPSEQLENRWDCLGFEFHEGEGNPVWVLIDTGRITDWELFHDVFAEAFGFPEYYGRNLDAFFDCLSCLDSPESGMTTVHARRNGLVLIELTDPADFKARCPRLYTELLKIIGEINARHPRRRILAMSIYPPSPDSEPEPDLFS